MKIYNLLNDSKIKQLVDLLKKKYVSYWNQTPPHHVNKDFIMPSKKSYSPFSYLDSTKKNPLRRTLVKLRIGCTTYVMKEVGTKKSLSMKEYVPFVVLIKLRTKPISY